MSVTGTWFIGTKAFENSLIELKEWRESTAASLAAFRRWAQVAKLIDDHAAARLAHLERRLAAERLTIAFVAEYSRGKSELINALFFGDLGARLLPAGPGRTTLCPTEILHDPSRPPSIRVLPIETRESAKSLREYIAEIDSWKEIPLDPSRPETLAAAFEVLSESEHVGAAEAANLGLPGEEGTRVEIPRWRYAVVNFPHPILKRGLVILDTPGHSALAAEPELQLNRVPDADAIVFIASVDAGVTPTDRALWVDHIAPIGSESHTRFIVLNKIDTLRSGSTTEAAVFSEIDRHVRLAAEALGVDPTRVFALSAKLGLVARVSGDRDTLMRSRLYRLEQALSQGLLHRRRHDHATSVRAEMRPVLAGTRALLDSRHAFTSDQVEELSALQSKNLKLIETLARKANGERARQEEARITVAGLRAMHDRQAEELARLLDPEASRARGLRAHEAITASAFSRGIPGALDLYFRESRDRLQDAIGIIAEVKKAMEAVNRKFEEDYGLAAIDIPAFGTERFLVELARLEEQCDLDFKSRSSLITFRRKTLGALFFDTVALKVIRIFEIADREVHAWMTGFLRPLEQQLSHSQDHTNSRIEGMARIRNAETDLVARLGELEKLVEEVDAQRREWDQHSDKLAALLDVERDSSLA